LTKENKSKCCSVFIASFVLFFFQISKAADLSIPIGGASSTSGVCILFSLLSFLRKICSIFLAKI